jgi:hypothetical protein
MSVSKDSVRVPGAGFAVTQVCDTLMEIHENN